MQVVQAQPTALSSGQEFLTKVYGWMTAGLALTGLVAYMTVETGAIMSILPYLTPLMFASLAFVWILQAKADSISATAASIGFVVYAALLGVVLSPIFVIYTQSSIAQVFFITAGTFGGMSIYGMTTKSDLSTVGSSCMMAFWGIFIASIVNIWLGSDQVSWIISFIGVFVFTGLAAYHNQRIMQMSREFDPSTETGRKGAIFGALALYVTFINLFLSLLRLMGSRR